MDIGIDLKTYLLRRGAAAQLAREIGVHPVMVSQWTDDGKPKQIAVEKCPLIERATGFQVRCESMRQDITWVRLPHPDWPRGKPLIDAVPEARGAGTALPETAIQEG